MARAEKTPGLPQIRATPEDFVVEEIPLYELSGEGGHTFLWVEKRLRNSDEVARDLARSAGVSARDVGYAGRKDRRAVTRQWFSVPGVEPQAARDFELQGAHVLEAIRHPHKLRTGQLRGNRFELAVRNVDADLAERAARALARMDELGMSNQFGAQRFGREGGNLERGRAILSRGGKVRGDRRAARFMLSALQSAVFNRVLEERPLPLERVEVGDVARVVASGGLFIVEDSERENLRAARFEISPTGPIFGKKMKRPEGQVASREEQVMCAMELPSFADLVVPRGLQLPGSRRSLRVRPAAVELVAEPEHDVLRMKFELPAGSYATVLLGEALGELSEGAGEAPSEDNAGQIANVYGRIAADS